MYVLAVVYFCALLLRYSLNCIVSDSVQQFIDPDWAKFKFDYSKSYHNDKEDMKRYEFFKEDLNKVEENNVKYEAGLVKWIAAINKYSDLSEDEYIQEIMRFTGVYEKNEATVESDRKEHEVTGCVPCLVNWDLVGYVSPMRNQIVNETLCASSYAMAAVAAVESHYAIINNKLIEFSPQEVLDCSLDHNNQGCKGGSLENAFKYMIDIGLGTEESYPYTAKDDDCRATPLGTNVTDFIAVPNELKMLDAVGSVGPVATTIELLHLRRYARGIFHCPKTGTGGGPSLAVLVVGYGIEEGVPYWLLKTSLGENWGERGYLRILRCDGTPQCGMYDSAYYPVVENNEGNEVAADDTDDEKGDGKDNDNNINNDNDNNNDNDSDKNKDKDKDKDKDKGKGNGNGNGNNKDKDKGKGNGNGNNKAHGTGSNYSNNDNSCSTSRYPQYHGSNSYISSIYNYCSSAINIE